MRYPTNINSIVTTVDFQLPNKNTMFLATLTIIVSVFPFPVPAHCPKYPLAFNLSVLIRIT